jgi:hypothetical protein
MYWKRTGNPGFDDADGNTSDEAAINKLFSNYLAL